MLPSEVVGAKGKLQTSCYLKIEEQSPMQWNFHKNLNSNITKGQKRTWEEFIRWLRLQPIETRWDFKTEWRWKMAVDRQVMSVTEGQNITCYKRKS